MQHDSTTLADLQALQSRLIEAEDMLRAIRAGEIDAVVVRDPDGEQAVYTLRNADYPYRTLVEQMQDGAAILSRDGDILYGNLSFAELVGMPLQEVIGGPVLRFFEGDARETVASLIASGSGKRRARLLASGGKAIDVLLSVTTTLTDDVERVSLIVTGLSELHDARLGRDQAEQRSQAKDEFMAMLAHELRNPLSAITAALEVLQTGGSSEGGIRQRARDIIGRQTRHLSRLVDDLLEVARAISGKMTLCGVPLDLADAVRRSVAQLVPRAGERHIEVAIESGPHWIHGDVVRIEQIITNVVSNAIKYTPSGGVIQVTLATADGEAVLCVRDNGLGIAPELLPEIFEPFVQGERTLDRAEGGLGVGLTLVRRLVELHGGTVSAFSEGPGQGSTFTIRLPRTPAPAAESAAPRAEVATQARRVLLIEDNRDARETFRMMLELAGHEVLEAEEGQTGLELLKSALPDIAVIDVGLPGLDGYEIASRFRREPQSNRVMLVAMTGYGTPEARERSRAAGFDHHLIKPVDPAVLRDLLIRSVPGTP